MGSTTSKLGMYLPGGGSTGNITPDEAADIDKINANMEIIDDAAGFQVVTKTTKPAQHYDGMPIYVSDEVDGAKLQMWSDSDSAWIIATIVPTLPAEYDAALVNGHRVFIQETEPTMSDGDVWFGWDA